MPVLKIKKTDGTWQEVWGCADNGASGDSVVVPKIINVMMLENAWVGSDELYYQDIICSDVTAKSKLDLQPDPTQIIELKSSEISLMLSNENGVTKAWAIGGKPETDYTISVFITNVDTDMSIIYGNLVGGGSSSLKTVLLVDENNNEFMGVVVGEETLLTAQDSDVLEGKIYVGDDGVSTGTHVCE